MPSERRAITGHNGIGHLERSPAPTLGIAPEAGLRVFQDRAPIQRLVTMDVLIAPDVRQERPPIRLAELDDGIRIRSCGECAARNRQRDDLRLANRDASILTGLPCMDSPPSLESSATLTQTTLVVNDTNQAVFRKRGFELQRSRSSAARSRPPWSSRYGRACSTGAILAAGTMPSAASIVYRYRQRVADDEHAVLGTRQYETEAAREAFRRLCTALPVTGRRHVRWDARPPRRDTSRATRC